MRFPFRLRAELRALTRQLQVTSVFVTHDQTEAMSMSDRVVVMNAGRIVAVDTPENLYSRPADRFVAEFLGAVNDLPGGGAVRPEAVRITRDDADVFATVEEVSYVGGHFETVCRVPGVDRPWLVRAPAAHPIGATVPLAVVGEPMLVDARPAPARV